MEIDWACVFSSNKLYEIEMVKGMLASHDVFSVVVNKSISVYQIGEFELHVNSIDIIKARTLINTLNY